MTAKAITRQDSIRFSLSHRVRQTDVAICVGVQSALAHLHSIINNKHKNNVSSFISSRWFADASLQGLWLFLPGEDILALYIPHLWVRKAVGFDQMARVTCMLQAGRLWSNIKGAWGETLGSTSEEVHSFKSHMWVNNKHNRGFIYTVRSKCLRPPMKMVLFWIFLTEYNIFWRQIIDLVEKHLI